MYIVVLVLWYELYLIASRVQKSATGADGFSNLNFGIKEEMVTSQFQISAAAAAEFWIFVLGIKEVMVASKL